ncbi:MAG: NAD(P)/FAD-dependent oxidoreductase, partial [Chloroflexota bacterium]
HVARVAGMQPAATPGLAAQAVVEGLDSEEIRVYAGGAVPRGFFGWVTPTEDGRSLVGVLGRHEPANALRSLMSSIAGSSPSGLTAAPLGIWGIPLRPAPRTYGDRLLMVGDAAGQVKPTTGGGIYYSLRSGDLAARALGEALREDDLRAVSLKRYEDAWRSVLGRELRLGYMARGIYERLGERELGRLIRIAASNGFLSGDLSFEWHSDLVTRALSYKLLDGVLSPVRGISSFISGRARV